MSIDNSVANPGPSGWGLPSDSPEDRIRAERDIFAQLSELAPARVSRHQAKSVDPAVNQDIIDMMAEDEVTGGFWCRYIEKYAYGDFIKWKRQLIGSCVASGGMRAMTRRMLIEHFLLQEGEDVMGGGGLWTRETPAPFAPYSYRAGRRIANINGSSDGSYCSAHTRGAMQFGILPCSTPGLESIEYPEPYGEPPNSQAERRAEAAYREWGASNSLMDKFSSVARKYQLLETEEIKNGDDAWTCLTEHKKPMMICSMWAFRPNYDHPRWKIAGKPVSLYKRNTADSWAHNVTIDAAIEAHGDRWGVIDNSWGEAAHKNGSFFILPWDLISTWIKDAEVYTIGNIDLADTGPPVDWR